MANTLNHSQAEILELYRIALENISTHAEAKATLAAFGFNSEKLDEGWQIYESTRQAIVHNIRQQDSFSQTSTAFQSAKERLNSCYLLHRKKANIIFANDPIAISTLLLWDSIPTQYPEWIHCIRTFYTELKADHSLLQRLAVLHIHQTDVDNARELISAVESAYQPDSCQTDATLAPPNKDNTMAPLDHWMHQFFALARIAFDEKPEILEILHKK